MLRTMPTHAMRLNEWGTRRAYPVVWWGFEWSGGFDEQGEVFDGLDDDFGSDGEKGVIGEAGLPKFTADLDLSCGGEGGAGDGEFADHGLGAEEDFVAFGAEGQECEAEGDTAEAEAGGDGYGEVDAELGDGGVDEGSEAEDQGGDGGCGEDSVAGVFEFEDEEDDGGD